jgi:hypothetical protein
MTPEQAREAAAVMLAFADGSRIECKYVNREEWSKVDTPVWNWDVVEYRVAPEPWTGKIWVHPDGQVERAIDGHNKDAWQKNKWKLITAKEVGDE